ncbi:hypothetical protein MTO96_004709 [Rhipicephalus appendiculatus]
MEANSLRKTVCVAERIMERTQRRRHRQNEAAQRRMKQFTRDADKEGVKASPGSRGIANQVVTGYTRVVRLAAKNSGANNRAALKQSRSDGGSRCGISNFPQTGARRHTHWQRMVSPRLETYV